MLAPNDRQRQGFESLSRTEKVIFFSGLSFFLTVNRLERFIYELEPRTSTFTLPLLSSMTVLN
jgi:hypothetical protein